MTAYHPIALARGIALFFLALALGCGGATPPPRETTTAGASIRNGGTSGALPPDPRRERELDPLRPAEIEPVLASLDRDPFDSEAYARGALALAGTDLAGMTLIWGQAYRVLDPHGRKTTDVAEAMERVIRERITVNGSELNLRFAPGAMPVVVGSDRRYYSPFAHLYEHSMSNTSSIATAPRETFEGAAQVFAAQIGVVCRDGEPVLPDEFYGFLCRIDAAGHRVAYAHWVIGPAFGSDFEAYERANSGSQERFRAFLASHPYEPTRETRPDDLYPVRPPSR